jgi:endonuclease-3
MVDAELRGHATKIRKRLERAIPEPRTELDWKEPWQLVVATILSAQSTDKMVNLVTPELFRRYPTPVALGAAAQDDVEALVKRTGFFRNKAKAIIGASRVIAERFGGEVPRTMEEMLELPGVARKTANVVVGSAHGVPLGFVVDTHVARVSQRLELTSHTDPVKIEQDLLPLFPKRDWVAMGHRLVLHGRYVCQAKRPLCERCPLNELCASARAKPAGRWTERADRERRLVESRGQVKDG